MSEIVSDAISQIDKNMNGPGRQDIENKIFESSLDGLSKGFMDYANDPLLPLVLSSL